MPWIKVDDHFDEHPKFAAAGPLGMAMWLAGMAYCNRNLTDGFIPWAVARNLVSWEWLGEPDGDKAPVHKTAYSFIDDRGDIDHEEVTSQHVIDLLIRVGLWTNDGYGYRVHDYEEYQPTRAQFEAEREQKRQAGRAGALARARAGAIADPKHPPQQNGSTRPSGTPAESKPVPVPVPVPVPSASNEALSPRATIDDDREGLPHLTPEAQEAIVEAAGLLLVGISDKVLTDLDGLVERHGLPAVCDSMAGARSRGATTWPQLVYRSRDRLEPLREPRLSPAEAARAERDEVVARIRRDAAAARGTAHAG